MAFTTPRTWVANELVTAAIMNTHVRDNLGWLFQPPSVRVYSSIAWTIGVSTMVAGPFDSERWDQAGGSASNMHDNVTNNTRLTCRYAGVYDIVGMVEWGGNSAGERLIEITLNGTTGIARERGVPNGVSVMNQVVSSQWQLAVNDYVELRVFQSSAVSLQIGNTPGWSPEFMMTQIA